MKQKIQPKDLITTGIFTAIMFVICMGVAMLGYIGPMSILWTQKVESLC